MYREREKRKMTPWPHLKLELPENEISTDCIACFTFARVGLGTQGGCHVLFFTLPPHPLRLLKMHFCTVGSNQKKNYDRL